MFIIPITPAKNDIKFSGKNKQETYVNPQVAAIPPSAVRNRAAGSALRLHCKPWLPRLEWNPTAMQIPAPRKRILALADKEAPTLNQIANKARPPSVEIKRNILASLTISNGSSLFIPSLSSGGAEALMLWWLEADDAFSINAGDMSCIERAKLWSTWIVWTSPPRPWALHPRCRLIPKAVAPTPSNSWSDSS